ncbi:hypothetical protein GQ457_10G008520 [Hibiscus cannabinus]
MSCSLGLIADLQLPNSGTLVQESLTQISKARFSTANYIILDPTTPLLVDHRPIMLNIQGAPSSPPSNCFAILLDDHFIGTSRVFFKIFSVVARIWNSEIYGLIGKQKRIIMARIWATIRERLDDTPFPNKIHEALFSMAPLKSPGMSMRVCNMSVIIVASMDMEAYHKNMLLDPTTEAIPNSDTTLGSVPVLVENSIELFGPWMIVDNRHRHSQPDVHGVKLRVSTMVDLVGSRFAVLDSNNIVEVHRDVIPTITKRLIKMLCHECTHTLCSIHNT